MTIAYLQMPYNFLPVMPHFPHIRVWGCKFDLAIEKSMVILGSSFDSDAIYQDSAEAFLVHEKIFRCFLSYMGMMAILFNDVEQIDNMPSTEGPKCNLVYIARGQGQITQEDKILIVSKRVCYFDHTL